MCRICICNNDFVSKDVSTLNRTNGEKERERKKKAKQEVFTRIHN